MNFCEFTAGEHTYKLCLNTKHIVALERRMGKNPLNLIISETIPKFEDLITILHEAMQQYNHSISMDDMYQIVDTYLANGHDFGNMIMLVKEVYESAGLIESDTKEENEKNA